MPKLYFRYGTMNSSKSANLLMVAHNYKSQGRKILLIKPEVDVRSGAKTIASRAIPGVDADIIMRPDVDHLIELTGKITTENVQCVLVDEAQFLSELNIDQLRSLTDVVPVICYGLRTDYKSRLFSGSKRLMEIADTIEEVKTVCSDCDKKAIINAKYYISSIHGKIITKEGSDDIDLGGEEKYQPLCWHCWTNCISN